MNSPPDTVIHSCRADKIRGGQIEDLILVFFGFRRLSFGVNYLQLLPRVSLVNFVRRVCSLLLFIYTDIKTREISVIGL